MVLRGDVILTWEGMSFSLGYYMTCVRIEAVLAYFYMQILVQYLPYIQIVLSVLLAAGVLVQQSAAGLGGAFGDNFSSGFHTRRGFEKTAFNGTIIIAILFVISAVASFMLK